MIGQAISHQLTIIETPEGLFGSDGRMSWTLS